MIIRGEKVTLRPMTKAEIPLFYQWATQSEATPFWYGDLTGESVPTYEKFIQEFPTHYFDGSQPEKGRSFIILVGDRAIGEINYNEIDRKRNSVDLDILIADEKDTGQGYGSDALKALADYLFQEMGIQVCQVDTIIQNERAIRAYEKAGFRKAVIFHWIRLELKRTLNQ